jgi:sigma-54 dependent transcriptional regulator, flagellar regulatory protein
MNMMNQGTHTLEAKNTIDLIGNSHAMAYLRSQIRMVAITDANVLILGESGTGKELVAKQIHLQSSRSKQSLIPVNCGAIPHELLESELFGHIKGAFTGATCDRPGRIEMANKGSLFLDEIGDMSLTMQVKLLRVLQAREYEKVGSDKTISADIRIIAATHKNLDLAVMENTFREDLFYRLNVFPIYMPALRDRRDDVPVLINEFILRINNSSNGSKLSFADEVIETLQGYNWPGNVRELENLVLRMSIIANSLDCQIQRHHLPNKYQTETECTGNSCTCECNVDVVEIASGIPENGIDLKEYMERIELNYIHQALEQAQGVVAHAAKLLGLRRTTLVEKMKKYDDSNSAKRHIFDIKKNLPNEIANN